MAIDAMPATAEANSRQTRRSGAAMLRCLDVDGDRRDSGITALQHFPGAL